MLSFCGFNGFGQFGKDVGRRVVEAKDFTIGSLCAKESRLWAVAWSYIVAVVGRELWIIGFIRQERDASLQLMLEDDVQDIAACDKCCLVALKSGVLLKLMPSLGSDVQEVKFASLDEGGRGRGPTRKRSALGEVLRPVEHFKIIHVACGDNIACAVSNRNDIFNIPSRIFQFEKHQLVQQLQCGFEHALLLLANGDLYTWGNGSRGQLGLNFLEVLETPTLVEALAGVKVIHIAASGWHSAAITAFHDLYVWGINANGQLGLRIERQDNGLKNPTVYSAPTPIDFPACCTARDVGDNGIAIEDCAPLQIFAGARHTIVKMSCGRVFGCGWNAHGQLGLNTADAVCDEFVKISLPWEANRTLAADIVCGAWCTIFKRS